VVPLVRFVFTKVNADPRSVLTKLCMGALMLPGMAAAVIAPEPASDKRPHLARGGLSRRSGLQSKSFNVDRRP